MNNDIPNAKDILDSYDNEGELNKALSRLRGVIKSTIESNIEFLANHHWVSMVDPDTSWYMWQKIVPVIKQELENKGYTVKIIEGAAAMSIAIDPILTK